MLESNFNTKDVEITDVIETVLDKFKYLDFNIVKTPINVRLYFKRIKAKVTHNWIILEYWGVWYISWSVRDQV